MTVDEALSLGFQWLQVGRLREAAEVFLRILEVVPDHFDARHLLGVALRRYGAVPAAFRQFCDAIAVQPGTGEIYVNLGNALSDLGRPAEALAAFRRALRLRPELVAAHMGLASLLRAQGRPAEALAAWQQAVTAAPDQTELHNGLGNSFQEQDRDEEAVAAYRRAIMLDPGYRHAYTNQGAALRGLGRLEEARASHRRALILQPDLAGAWSGLGLVLADCDRLEDPLLCQRHALALQPDFTGAWNNLGSAWLALNRLREAVACYRRAVSLNPAEPVSHRNLGMALLTAGEMAAAWPEYEWRLRCPDSPVRIALPRPQWDGSPLGGQTLLLHAEQGLGDTLQCVRYVPLAAARGARVMVCAAAEFARLFASLEGMAAFVPAGAPVPAFDCHAPLMSLPGIFRTTLAAIPARVPYLHAPPALIAGWRDRLEALCPRRAGLRVGLVWAGSTGHGNDRNRSLPLAAFAGLAALPGVRVVSVQKGVPAAQAEPPPPGMELVMLSPEIADFADTAAIMAALDLVVTVDTSVAHLAGALGRPVWVLLPYSPDWRWMLHREDSPWYPSMRLFRQERPGVWGPVVDRLVRYVRILTGA